MMYKKRWNDEELAVLRRYVHRVTEGSLPLKRALQACMESLPNRTFWSVASRMTLERKTNSQPKLAEGVSDASE